MSEKIKRLISSSINTKKQILENADLIGAIEEAVELIVNAYKNGNKVLFCGNGGSAADAQHLAAELSGRFYYDRPPLNAEALHVNSSYLTAVANDYGYEFVYSRLLEGCGAKGDILIALSTSGNSSNILKAIETAENIGVYTIGLTGQSGGKMNAMCNLLINVPSKETPRIQESHILIGHIICQLVEETMFPKKN